MLKLNGYLQHCYANAKEVKREKHSLSPKVFIRGADLKTIDLDTLPIKN